MIRESLEKLNFHQLLYSSLFITNSPRDISSFQAPFLSEKLHLFIYVQKHLAPCTFKPLPSPISEVSNPAWLFSVFFHLMWDSLGCHCTLLFPNNHCLTLHFHMGSMLLITDIYFSTQMQWEFAVFRFLVMW